MLSSNIEIIIRSGKFTHDVTDWLKPQEIPYVIVYKQNHVGSLLRNMLVGIVLSLVLDVFFGFNDVNFCSFGYIRIVKPDHVYSS